MLLKKGRNIVLFSGESDVGKSYFLNSLKIALEGVGAPIGTYTTGGRFSFMFAQQREKLVAIADDVPLSGMEDLEKNQGLLDGETEGAIDQKYGKVVKGNISPLWVATNVNGQELDKFATLRARCEIFNLFGSKKRLGELFMNSRDSLTLWRTLLTLMSACAIWHNICFVSSFIWVMTSFGRAKGKDGVTNDKSNQVAG